MQRPPGRGVPRRLGTECSGNALTERVAEGTDPWTAVAGTGKAALGHADRVRSTDLPGVARMPGAIETAYSGSPLERTAEPNREWTRDPTDRCAERKAMRLVGWSRG